MNRTTNDWNACLPSILDSIELHAASVDHRHLRFGVNAYLVRSFDGSTLQCAVPVTVPRFLSEEVGLDTAGTDGAVSAIIETIKHRVPHVPALGAIGGAGTRYPARYAGRLEPFTVISSRQEIGTALWKPDRGNRADHEGTHLVVTAAFPDPGSPGARTIRNVGDLLGGLVDAVGSEVQRVPRAAIERAWRTSLDQKDLRQRLTELGLVCFFGDGTRPARECTPERCYFRVAGPKSGNHVPFVCPPELDPVEVDLSSSGATATGLGIRRREVFAVTGSNAEGKSTFLQAVIAGEDDHAEGDGRERVVTLPGIALAEAGGQEIRGGDVSLFFDALPPGLSGTPASVFGQGSGSLVMAAQIQAAVKARSPLLVIDEDRAAANLLVGSCLQAESVTPLARIIAERREAFDETGILFAAGALDLLTAEADRILQLDRHEARYVDRAAFRKMLRHHLGQAIQTLESHREPDRDQRGG